MDRHAKFLKMTLNMLPSSAAGYDMQRMTILYFAVSGILAAPHGWVRLHVKPFVFSFLINPYIEVT